MIRTRGGRSSDRTSPTRNPSFSIAEKTSAPESRQSPPPQRPESSPPPAPTPATAAFIPSLIAAFLTSKYQLNPYDEFVNTVAAIVHPSDSVTIAVPAITQNPTNVSIDRIITTGISPFGIAFPRQR